MRFKARVRAHVSLTVGPSVSVNPLGVCASLESLCTVGFSSTAQISGPFGPSPSAQPVGAVHLMISGCDRGNVRTVRTSL